MLSDAYSPSPHYCPRAFRRLQRTLRISMHETGVTRALVCGFVVSLPTDSETSITADRIKCIFAALSPRSAGSFARHHRFSLPVFNLSATLQMGRGGGREGGLPLRLRLVLARNRWANLTSSCQLRIPGHDDVGELPEVCEIRVSIASRKKNGLMDGGGQRVTAEFYLTEPVDDQTICIIGRLHKGSWNINSHNLYTLGGNNSL